MKQLQSAGRPVKRLELWVFSAVTPRAMQELESAGIEVHAHALETLTPKPTDDEATKSED